MFCSQERLGIHWALLENDSLLNIVCPCNIFSKCFAIHNANTYASLCLAYAHFQFNFAKNEWTNPNEFQTLHFFFPLVSPYYYVYGLLLFCKHVISFSLVFDSCCVFFSNIAVAFRCYLWSLHFSIYLRIFRMWCVHVMFSFGIPTIVTFAFCIAYQNGKIAFYYDFFFHFLLKRCIDCIEKWTECDWRPW